MICPECAKQGLRSKVYGNGHGTRTLLYCQPFYDEDGRYHDHDSNVTTQDFHCSNKHEWTTKTSGSCWCGWGKV